jgi:hypothetical protein
VSHLPDCAAAEPEEILGYTPAALRPAVHANVRVVLLFECEALLQALEQCWLEVFVLQVRLRAKLFESRGS